MYKATRPSELLPIGNRKCSRLARHRGRFKRIAGEEQEEASSESINGRLSRNLHAARQWIIGCCADEIILIFDRKMWVVGGASNHSPYLAETSTEADFSIPIRCWTSDLAILRVRLRTHTEFIF